MTPHQERVVKEKAELDERREKLSVFMLTDTFYNLQIDEKCRLKLQLGIMGQYSDVLSERIDAFPKSQDA